MPTVKTRINISADREIESALNRAAKRDRVPIATKAAELLRLALELEEDLILAELVNKRLAGKPNFLSHDRAWL